jgi:hypothetical protein
VKIQTRSFPYILNESKESRKEFPFFEISYIALLLFSRTTVILPQKPNPRERTVLKNRSS